MSWFWKIVVLPLLMPCTPHELEIINMIYCHVMTQAECTQMIGLAKA